MKHITTILILAITSQLAFAQGKSKEKPALTFEVKHNGKTHTVTVGDTVHIGYGSYPSGSFMYIYVGSPPKGLDKQFAAKTGIVSRVKYVKPFDQYQLYIKGRFGTYIVDLPQAVEKKEIVGFNKTFFE